MTAGSNGSIAGAPGAPDRTPEKRIGEGRKDDARQFAAKIAADEQFGERAREILARLGKQP